MNQRVWRFSLLSCVSAGLLCAGVVEAGVMFPISQSREVAATGSGYSDTITAPGFGLMNETAFGSGGHGAQGTPPWSTETSEASQYSLALVSPAVSVSVVNAEAKAEQFAAGCAGHSDFEFVFTLTAEHSYFLAGTIGAELLLTGTGTGLARTTTSLVEASAGTIFSETIEFTATGAGEPGVPHFGTLQPGTYTFTVGSQCEVSVASGVGTAEALARHNVTLTVHEPCAAGLLLLGGLLVKGLRRWH